MWATSLTYMRSEKVGHVTSYEGNGPDSAIEEKGRLG